MKTTSRAYVEALVALLLRHACSLEIKMMHGAQQHSFRNAPLKKIQLS